MANGGDKSNPALGLRFEVTVDGVQLGAFTACDGLEATYEVEEYKEGGVNGFVHRLPGRLKYSNIKLTRPLDAQSPPIAAWISKFQSSCKRTTAAITAYDAANKRVQSWNLREVWPVRWGGPSFGSDKNEVAKETLELAHHGFL